MPFILETELDDDDPEIQMLRLVWRLTEKDIEDQEEADILDGVELGRLDAWRYNIPAFDPSDMSRIYTDFDDRDGDLESIASDILEKRKSIFSLIDEEKWYDTGPQGLLIGYRLDVPKHLRGQRIGLELLKALQRFHAGFPCLFALQAVPMELEWADPGFAALQKRLIAYYASAEPVGLKSLPHHPSTMISLWDGEEYAEAPFGFFDYAELAERIRAHRSEGKDVS